MEQKRLHLLSLHTLLCYGSQQARIQAATDFQTMESLTPPFITPQELTQAYNNVPLAEKMMLCTLHISPPTKVVPQQCKCAHPPVSNKHHQKDHQ